MGELRDRMVRDMDVRHFSQRTVEAYVAGVKGLAKYYMRSPEHLSDEEVQRYLLYIREERKLSASTCNQIRCALKFFYEVTVRRPQVSLAVPPMRQAQKLPQILSREEVERIIAATRTLARAAVAHGGLRRRAAGQRGGSAAPGRPRCRARGHPRRARQRQEGPLHGAGRATGARGEPVLHGVRPPPHWVL